MLRRLQRVGAQAIAALWPDMPAPRTPSWTADWLEVAAGRLEAWKGSSARAGARRALEFVKVWYPGLNLAQLTMFRLEAQEETEDKETRLIAEFAIERSAWTDKEAMLTAGFGEIEDMVDGERPSLLFLRAASF